MAAAFGDDLSRSMSSRRSWRSQMWQGQPDVFTRGSRQSQAFDEEEELKWAAIERLPTYDRMRKGILRQNMSNGRVVRNEVDVANLGAQDKQQLMERILKVVEDDNERFLQRLKNRTDRVGIEIPKIEVRFQNLSIEGDAYVGTRALPTLLNSTLNAIEALLGTIDLSPSKKRIINILKDVSGIIKPSREHPRAKWIIELIGFWNFLVLHLVIYLIICFRVDTASWASWLRENDALSASSDDNLKINGKITYCGHEFKEFVPQRTCAYISQNDLHNGEMTLRETLDFSGRCLGVGTRYVVLAELSRRKKEAGIKPDPEIDTFMKATAMVGQEQINVLIMVGDDMRRGISGGQKKRVTTGTCELHLM
ncbi:LOW QUALITY PROTEIN: hypothetical protein RJ639_026087 [Escallonia herrerae]|uniref:Pleiotropic ABC efflux transporter N-terminal domain-containing protein n=1 Tax=Escallonia herrerae TaxID=1293975 RepID=A0AA88SCD3_9ASTE|nr:LOW QUALITY PROTEIN: hypothetical protein RJ639_026087 [Escallonia herrerae]